MKRRGSVLMEFIIVAPLMLILISMILQFAQIWIAREITAYAAYCACRSVLSANEDDAAHGAQKAAELACSWMCLAGLPGAASSGGGSEDVTLPRYHDRDDFSDTETVDYDDGDGVAGEVRIPGWGSIPGSDSAPVRVTASIVSVADRAVVRVEFKFPLLMPLVGRMVSLFVNSDETSAEGESGKFDYGSHSLADGSNPAWRGETYVMDSEGNRIRTDASVAWGSDGRFPYITLTDYCMLPKSYSGKGLPRNSYADRYPTEGGGL